MQNINFNYLILKLILTFMLAIVINKKVAKTKT